MSEKLYVKIRESSSIAGCIGFIVKENRDSFLIEFTKSNNYFFFPAGNLSPHNTFN